VTRLLILALSARVLRCEVWTFDSSHGVTYRGALQFEERCDLVLVGESPSFPLRARWMHVPRERRTRALVSAPRSCDRWPLGCALHDHRSAAGVCQLGRRSEAVGSALRFGRGKTSLRGWPTMRRRLGLPDESVIGLRI
jgi:hypothetical protein